MQVSICEIGCNLEILAVDPAFYDMFGYSEDDLRKRNNLSHFFDTSQCNRLEKESKEIFGGQPLGKEISIAKKKDGSWFPCELQLKPINGRDGITGYRVLIIDITDIVDRFEGDQRRQFHEWFDCICGNMPGGLLLISDKMVLEEMNDYALNFLGYDREEVIGQALSTILCEFEENYNILTRQGAIHDARQIFRNKAGRQMPTIANYRKFMVSGQDKFIACFHDLLEVIGLKRAIKTNEIKYKSFVEIAHEGIVFLDKDGIITFHNNAFAKMLGFEEESLTGLNFRKLSGEDESDKYRKSTDEIIRGERERYETVLIGDDGLRHNVIVSVTSLLRRDGYFEGMIALVLDITELRENERLLKKQKANLKDLAKHFLELHESDRKSIVRELHDCIGQKAALARLRLSKIIQRKSGDDKEHLEEISNIISDISDDLRDISCGLRPRILDEFGLVPAIEWHLGKFLGESGISHDFSIKGKRKALSPDLSINIYRIFQEMILNILKHSGADRAEICLEFLPGNIILKVSDNGRGFDVEKFKLNETFKSSFGLLNISERVDIMSGQLDINSGEGKGTIITVILPVK
jgi:two-component system sensor histidine kinase DegS